MLDLTGQTIFDKGIDLKKTHTYAHSLKYLLKTQGGKSCKSPNLANYGHIDNYPQISVLAKKLHCLKMPKFSFLNWQLQKDNASRVITIKDKIPSFFPLSLKSQH